MKFTSLLTILALAVSIHTANAEETAEEQEFLYCKEQIDTYGIEDAREKEQMLQECLDSFKSPSGDEPAPQE